MVKTITEHIDHCCGCPPEMGCMGQACPYHSRNEERTALICDACGEEADKLCRAPYQAEESWVCKGCLQEILEWKDKEAFLT